MTSGKKMCLTTMRKKKWLTFCIPEQLDWCACFYFHLCEKWKLQLQKEIICNVWSSVEGNNSGIQVTFMITTFTSENCTCAIKKNCPKRLTFLTFYACIFNYIFMPSAIKLSRRQTRNAKILDNVTFAMETWHYFSATHTCLFLILKYMRSISSCKYRFCLAVRPQRRRINN